MHGIRIQGIEPVNHCIVTVEQLLYSRHTDSHILHIMAICLKA